MYSDMCKYFYREKEFYNAALKIEGQNSFKDYLIETVSPLAEFFLKDILPHNEDDSFVVAFVTDALLTSLVRWLSNGYGREIGAEEYIAKIKDISMQIGSMVPAR